MEHKQFQNWMSGLDSLSQGQNARFVVGGDRRECVADGNLGAVGRNPSMSALQHSRSGFPGHGAGAPTLSLQGLQEEDVQRSNRHSFTGPSHEGQVAHLWDCLADGLTVRKAAERCNLAVSTSFVQRQRFLGTQDQTPPKLTGILEVDETYVLESQKGNRNLDRKAHRRGGKASKRGLSDEQVPILVAVDSSGTTICSVLPSVTADNVQTVLEPRIEDDILLVTDGNNVYPGFSSWVETGLEQFVYVGTITVFGQFKNGSPTW